MMGRHAIVLGLAAGSLFAAAPESGAQVLDHQAQQRCVWTCLANSPGIESPEYHQCVAAKCIEPGQAAQQTPEKATGQVTGQEPQQGQTSQQAQAATGNVADKRSGRWRDGLASDGVTRFAGAEDPARNGSGLYYMCTPSGDSYLMLTGLKAKPGLFRLRADGAEYAVIFDGTADQLTADLPPRRGLLGAIQRGRKVSVLNRRGREVLRLDLRRSRGAITAAYSDCGV